MYNDDRIVEFPALKQAQEKLDEKRKGLKGILDEAGPDFDMAKVKSLAGDTHAKVAEIGKLNREIDDCKKKVDDLLIVARAAAEAKRQDEGAQSGDGAAPPASRGRELETKTFGELFAESRALKEYGRGHGPSANLPIELKTLFQTTDGWKPESTRTGIFSAFPTRPAPQVVDAIPTMTTSMELVKYMEETVYNNAAAETAEGALYKEVALKVVEKEVPVRKITAFLPMTDEQLADEPGVSPYVNQRLPFMLRQRLDSQVLVGDGVAPNLLGTENVPGIQTQALGGDPVPDAIYKAARKIRDDGFSEPSVVFITPAKWEGVRLMKTADGVYLWGHPSIPGVETIWGIPVVQTTAVSGSKAILGDYVNHSALFTRQGIDVQVSNSHADFFQRGQVAIRASFRVAMVHLRPKAFAAVTGLT
ncbi:phage major capsid protein [Streptomyces sp. NPDC015131]|uniref:phage major capsid protein n=1 Tax=Streptomyces sp. NPDC015131 TaxID=3364941 RepID=UPI0037033CB2